MSLAFWLVGTQEVAADGSYRIALDGRLWFVSGPTELIIEGRLHRNTDGSLRATSNGTRGSGTDAIGPHEWFAVNFTVLPPAAPEGVANGPDGHNVSGGREQGHNGLLWGTRFALYADGSTLAFRQTFYTGIANFSGRSAHGATAAEWGTPGSGFPTFDASGQAKLGGPNGLGYVSYGEIGRTRTGRFPSGYKSGGNEEDGVPLALLDESTGIAVMLSPSQGFYDNVFAVVDEGPMEQQLQPPRSGGAPPDGGATYLRCGLIGTAASVPAGMALETILHVGPAGTRRGMTDTLLSWGELLLRAHGGKPRAAADSNAQIAKLGYSTVGHYFYGIESGKTAGETLRHVSITAAAPACGLRFGYFLVDSFWYAEGAIPTPDGGSTSGFGGTWRWDDVVARNPAMFPRGLPALTMDLDAPLVMHMGQWVGSSAPSGPPPYAANASWDWVVEAKASLPRPGSPGAALFWDWLFSDMAANGLAV